jgi:hypothetical protein
MRTRKDKGAALLLLLLLVFSGGAKLLSQKVFIMSFCKSQFPHKSVSLSFMHESVSLSFIVTNVKKKLTNFQGNWFLQNDLIQTFREIRANLDGGALLFLLLFFFSGGARHISQNVSVNLFQKVNSPTESSTLFAVTG